MPSSVSPRDANYTFGIITGDGCAWTARTDSTWSSVTPGAGVGSATTTLNVGQNPRAGNARTLTVTVNNQSFSVVQQADPCVFTLSSQALDARNEGSSLEVRVTTQDGCAWSVSTSASWITLRSTGSTGTDYARFDAAPNTGSTRQGTVVVAGQAVTVTQAGN